MMRFLWAEKVTKKYTFLSRAETGDTPANRSWNKSNLAGRRGGLTVEAPTKQRKGHDLVWRCFCDCGGLHSQHTDSIRQRLCRCLKIGKHRFSSVLTISRGKTGRLQNGEGRNHLEHVQDQLHTAQPRSAGYIRRISDPFFRLGRQRRIWKALVRVFRSPVSFVGLEDLLRELEKEMDAVDCPSRTFSERGIRPEAPRRREREAPRKQPYPWAASVKVYRRQNGEMQGEFQICKTDWRAWYRSREEFMALIRAALGEESA